MIFQISEGRFINFFYSKILSIGIIKRLSIIRRETSFLVRGSCYFWLNGIEYSRSTRNEKAGLVSIIFHFN